MWLIEFAALAVRRGVDRLRAWCRRGGVPSIKPRPARPMRAPHALKRGENLPAHQRAAGDKAEAVERRALGRAARSGSRHAVPGTSSISATWSTAAPAARSNQVETLRCASGAGADEASRRRARARPRRKRRANARIDRPRAPRRSSNGRSRSRRRLGAGAKVAAEPACASATLSARQRIGAPRVSAAARRQARRRQAAASDRCRRSSGRRAARAASAPRRGSLASRRRARGDRRLRRAPRLAAPALISAARRSV